MICSEVNEVQHLILFNAIYDEECGNEVERFNNAKSKMVEIGDLLENNEPADIIYNTFKNIFDKIKDLLSYNESKADLLISQIKDYFKIKAKTELIKDLTIIFKSKKYEMDLNSMIFFFENFNPNDINWNKNFPKGFEELSKKDLKDIKKILNELKDKGIYDYEKTINYFKLFTSLYGKKDAIYFLLSKINKDITYLRERINPIIQNLNLKDIEDAEECVKIFGEFKDKDNFTIFEYIKNQLNEQQINKFESYSKNYSAIIDLDRNDNSSFNIFGKVDKIILNAKFKFKQDKEEFYYGENRANETNIKELILLKNNICIKAPEKTNDSNNSKDIFQIKCDKLLFFKDIVSELEVIYDNMNTLRIKGSSLPLLIILEINYPNKKYLLNNEGINIQGIKDFLFKAKKEQIYQLDLIYNHKKYLRFLYGIQFRTVIKHLEDETSLFEIIRYILNNTNSKENIIDGKKINPKIVYDYTEADAYKLYIENSFNNISDYIISLFENNNTSLEKHYNKMLIKVESKYNGFYSYKCEQDESMEEFILNIFLEKTKCFPVAQNVLITNEGTSSEEIQAFFYRAILFEYNTLFIVEINDSFTEYQQNIMNIYINKIINESEKNNVNSYFKSCIIFIYKKNNSFLNELEKFNIQEMGKNEGKKQKIIDLFKDGSLNKIGSKFENIKIFTSDICGLGKSYRIKKIIKSKNKEYFYFPLGGLLTKAIIYGKLIKLINKIKNEFRDNYEKIAIHLDLKESKDISIINEFLFSFLITKFYINSGNIIYIPKEIEIYIEISNCFQNYISKLNLLKIFNIENISINEIPKLELQEDSNKVFNEALKLKSTEEIENLIKKYIGSEKYSYHQVNIFIKMLTSSFIQFKSKIVPLLGEKLAEEAYIEEFFKFVNVIR